MNKKPFSILIEDGEKSTSFESNKCPFYWAAKRQLERKDEIDKVGLYCVVNHSNEIIGKLDRPFGEDDYANLVKQGIEFYTFITLL